MPARPGNDDNSHREEFQRKIDEIGVVFAFGLLIAVIVSAVIRFA
jgi:hypothetical protein